MANRFDPRKVEREMRAAAQKADRELKREVERVNRENQRRVDAHNRKVDTHNRKVARDAQREVDAHNRKVDAHNRKADAHNKRVIDEINRQLRATSTGPRYTPNEEALANRIQFALPDRDDREWDSFLSYAQIDGADVGAELRDRLDELGVSVWFGELTIVPGKSQALQMDKGLQKARAGIVLLTPAYVAGRFWTERELGALLGKETLIPVLHNVTFEQVAEYSGILPDLAGFETARDSVEIIAQKIAAALLSD
jgi:hypothetical protein